jgi:hypothetical protein
MSETSSPTEPAAQDELSASVQVLPLAEGMYFVSVRSASAIPGANVGDLALPAVYVGPAPGRTQGDVGVMAGPFTSGNWLHASGDSLVVKVPTGSANLVLISVRAAGGEPLAIDVERLENRGGEEENRQVVLQGGASEHLVEPSNKAAIGLHFRAAAHIRNRGDVTFADSNWIGRLGRGLWIESFSVTPLEEITAAQIEYKAVTASGIESPWITNGASCGTRGLGLPLVGFACRLRPDAAIHFQCEYSGYFQSGAIIGPLINGEPCRSTTANDPLEGIRIQITARETAESRRDSASPTIPRKSATRSREQSGSKTAKGKPNKAPKTRRGK